MESTGCPPGGNDHQSKASAPTCIVNAANIYYLPEPGIFICEAFPPIPWWVKEMNAWMGGKVERIHVVHEISREGLPVFSLLFLL